MLSLIADQENSRVVDHIAYRQGAVVRPKLTAAFRAQVQVWAAAGQLPMFMKGRLPTKTESQKKEHLRFISHFSLIGLPWPLFFPYFGVLLCVSTVWSRPFSTHLFHVAAHYGLLNTYLSPVSFVGCQVGSPGPGTTTRQVSGPCYWA